MQTLSMVYHSDNCINANFVCTVGSTGCHNNNLFCQQWWQSWHYDNSLVFSVCLYNSLRPSDAIWRQKSPSTLAQVMAWCLMAPSHHLNQCWLFIIDVLQHSPEGYFTASAQATILYEFKNHTFNITAIFPRRQWVKVVKVLRGFHLNVWLWPGIIQCIHWANERWCYNVTPSLIGWAHTQNDPWWHNPMMRRVSDIWLCH